MRKLIIASIIVFLLAMVFPDARNTIITGAFCMFVGLMLGVRHGGKHRIELMEARAERLAEVEVTL